MKKTRTILASVLLLIFASPLSAQNLRVKEIHNLFSDDLGERERILYKAMGSQRGFFSNPSWSPDGTKIAFAFSIYVEPTSIWVVNADGTGLRKISNKDDEHPSWSPDGNRIAFIRYNTALDRPEIWVMNADGTNQTFLRIGVDPAWGPTGQLSQIKRLPLLVTRWKVDRFLSNSIRPNESMGNWHRWQRTEAVNHEARR